MSPKPSGFYLLDIYAKNEKDDLAADEKKALAKLAADYKREAIAAFQRKRS
jgi:hypothetical protein